jgi:hypothetical protein
MICCACTPRETCQQTDTSAYRTEAETRLVSHYTTLAGFLDSCVALSCAPAAGSKAGRDRAFPDARGAGRFPD